MQNVLKLSLSFSQKRALVIISAVMLHLCIGSVYTWSVFVNPLMSEMNCSLKEVQLIFSIAIFFLGMSAAFMGKFVEKNPRRAGLLSAIFFSTGFFCSALAVSLKSLPLLYFAYGVLGGIGLGIGYITPISTLVKWLPNNRGLATGLAIMGFGFAAIVFAPLIQYLLMTVSIPTVFTILGCMVLVVMGISSQCLFPAEQTLKTQEIEHEATRPVKDIIRTREFISLWFMLFINISCGIALISVASPMTQELLGVSAVQAATIVGLMGIFNGLGRFVWSSISDYIGRPMTYSLFFILQAVAFYFLFETKNIYLFQMILFLIISCYGGGFATIPAYLSDLFGTKQLSNIHGKILTAWSCAGIAGAVVVSVLKEITNSYANVLPVFAVVFALSSIFSCALQYRISKQENINTKS